jgi:hypothetical protein
LTEPGAPASIAVLGYYSVPLALKESFVLIGVPALVIAGAVVAGAAVAGIVGPWLHRRRPRPERPSDIDFSPKSPVEAKRQAGPSYFVPPGA